MARLTYPDFEALVIDNASADGTLESLRTEFPHVRSISSPKNLGYAGGCNLGIRNSNGRYVLLLNNDTEIVDPNALEVLVRTIESDDRTAAVGPRIVDYADHTRILFDGGGDVYAFIDISGAAFLARREALEQVGLFDESLFAYYEDRDLFARLQKAGWNLKHVREVRVSHMVSATAGPGSPAYYYLHNRNLLIYLRRHVTLRRIAFRILPHWTKWAGWFLKRVLTTGDWASLWQWLRGYLDGVKVLVHREMGRIPRRPMEPSSHGTAERTSIRPEE